jgi:hypothetical protein
VLPPGRGICHVGSWAQAPRMEAARRARPRCGACACVLRALLWGVYPPRTDQDAHLLLPSACACPPQTKIPTYCCAVPGVHKQTGAPAGYKQRSPQAPDIPDARRRSSISHVHNANGRTEN